MGDEEVSKLRHELSQKKKSIELLQASNLDQGDQIRALTRSSEDAKKKKLLVLGLLDYEQRCHEKEVRSHEEKVAALTQKLQTLEEGKNEARSFEEEINALTQKVQLLEGGRNGARSSEEEITKLTQKVQMLTQKVHTLEEGRDGARSHEEEITTLTEKVRMLEEDPARIIGNEVRLRFMENYRKRIKRKICAKSHERIKIGNRAAHRGRPVADALLCLAGEIQDRNVYPDLYGVSPEMMKNWKDVLEMVEVTGFRASLEAVGHLTAEFQVPFKRLVELATEFKSSPELKGAFAEKQVLQQLHSQVQYCYDGIVAANPWIRTPKDNGNCGSGRVDV